jgi:hypothetical protein
VTVLFLIFLFIFSSESFAHGGRLNSAGCHNQNKDQTYHCHQGPLAGKSFSSRQQAEASTAAEELPIPSSSYRREDFLSSWRDADGDCINTRHEVLQATSLVTPVMSGNGCNIVGGRWYDPYTGQFYNNPQDLDIDHVVPLAEAHRSGANLWAQRKKQAYANDLNHIGFLLPVYKSANRSKGDKDPANWMPENLDFHCEYLSLWISIKEEYSLSMDAREKDSIEKMRIESC